MSTVDQSLLEIKKILSVLSKELTSVNAKIDGTSCRVDAVKLEIDSIKSEMLESEKRSKARSDAVRLQLIDMENRTASKIDAVQSEIDTVQSEMLESEKRSISGFDNVIKEIDSIKSEMLGSEKRSKARSDAVRVQLMDMEKSTASKIDAVKSEIGENLKFVNGEFTKLEKNALIRFKSLLRESMSLKADISDARDEITKEIVSVATSNNAAMEEQKASTTIVAERLSEGIIVDLCNKLTEEMYAIKEAVGQQSSTLEQIKIDSMETKVVNKDISEEIKQSVLESLNATRQGPSVQSNINLIQLEKKFPVFLRNVCVHSLVGKTVIHGDDSSKLSIVRSRYERLYSSGPLVSILMKFLLFHPKVRVHVDFGSINIGRMKGVIDFDGNKHKGGGWSTFPDLEEERVYLGGYGSEDCFIALLAHSLCTMCLHLLYGNGGLPFEKDGDLKTEKNWDEMLQEAEGKEGRGRKGLGDFTYALNMKTRKGKLIELISRVPSIIASKGSPNGINKVREWLPSILDLYEQQVVPDLTRDWESKMAA